MIFSRFAGDGSPYDVHVHVALSQPDQQKPVPVCLYLCDVSKLVRVYFFDTSPIVDVQVSVPQALSVPIRRIPVFRNYLRLPCPHVAVQS